MTCEEAISILEQGHYQYEIINDDQTTLLVRGVVFCDIKGGAFLTIDSLNNISRIAIGFENGDVDNKAAILYEHLCKLYGDPIEIKENDLSKIFGDKYKYCYFKKNNMEIEFLYPISEDRDMFSIGIHWYYENS